MGLKYYVINIQGTSEEKIYNQLKKMNDDYLSALLDMKKANEAAQKKLGKSFGEVYKVLEKINPPEKKKKHKARKKKK